MAIVHMSKRVDRFMNQLDLHDENIHPDPQLFDYEDKKEIYLFDEEISIMLPDFEILFGLIVRQTGTYDPGDGLCQPPEFNEETTEVEIEDLIVYDSVYGEELRFNREEFTEVVNKVKTLILI